MTTMNISVVNNMHLNAKVWFTLIHKANIHSAESKLVPTRNIKGLLIYYVSQNQGFLDTPSPLRQQWSAFAIPLPA